MAQQLVGLEVREEQELQDEMAAAQQDLVDMQEDQVEVVLEGRQLRDNQLDLVLAVVGKKEVQVVVVLEMVQRKLPIQVQHQEQMVEMGLEEQVMEPEQLQMSRQEQHH